MQFIGKQGNYRIVELTATVENKGKVQHRMEEFHSWFKYGDNRKFSHTAERTVAVPQEIESTSIPLTTVSQSGGTHGG